ncbi:MAG: ABC transporter ATP-binding protein [Halobacteriovoraceae bacterium]|nr:ABC transporter ATP-binding protein [Halobacteriovoraceae bacterium]
MLLEVENLSIDFKTKKGTLQAVRDISFSLERGETLGVVGESGCGKSITNLALMGLLPDTGIVKADKIQFEGIDLLTLKDREWQKIRGKEVSMIFQDPMSALNPSFTVGYQIEETLILHEPDLNKEQRHLRCIELLNQVGIPAPEKRLHSYAHELSGGMSQRVMIAMAIACKPKLLIADEPTTALDVTIQDQILRLLKELQVQYNMAMIFVTHDLGVVAKVSDKIQVMYAGEIVERSPIADLLKTQKHPYTKGLLNSLPGQKGLKFRTPLPSIKGMVPALNQRPEGCQFAPRCEFKQDICSETPVLTEDLHAYRCHFPLEGGEK